MLKLLHKIKDYFLIKRSGLFDADYYCLQYPDVRRADVNPLWHFVSVGWKEGRNPSYTFITKLYLEANQDVAQAGIDPLVHYIRFGRKEGRATLQDHLHVTQSLRSLSLQPYNENTGKLYIEQTPVNRFYHLLQKSTETLLKQGPKSLILKIRVYIYKQKNLKKLANRTDLYVNQYKNVFVNIKDDGESTDLEQPQILKKLEEEVIKAFNFLPNQNPLVSIIIPTYNHISDTLKCLYSIVSANEKTNYEIIIADDGSRDDTFKIIRQCRGIRLIKNSQNLGFLKNCNKAAKEARGQFLVYLNNDTVVLPNWLDSLVQTFVDFPNTGLVGSKLLYPDGKLQEAGGIIWSDGSGWNYGRGDDPQKPKYNYLREVDYCSAASIMIPKSIWNSLGGFDEMFAPAYYEDTDLAFRVWKAGYKVFYQPKSQVIHFEGLSSGTDVTTGVKHYQEVNRLKFFERWKDVLKAHGTSEQMNEHQYRNRYARGHALFVDATTPTPDQDSGSIDAFHYLSMLRQWGFEVSFIPANIAYFGKYTDELQKLGVECLYFPYINSVGDYIKNEGYCYDLVVLSRAPVAAEYIDIVREFAPQAKILFSTVDLHFLREKREAELCGSHILKIAAQETEKIEIGIMRKAHRTIVVSEAEYEMLRRLDPNISVSLVSIPREITGRRNNFEDRRDIVFIGGYNHPPNIDAVQFFTSEIWPIVTEALPDVKFIIAGSNMPDSISQLSGKNIIVRGYVEDLGEIFDHCRLSVAPLRYGAGIKGKIVTSLSYGVPCVATAIAKEGMGLIHGESILVAETVEDFANAVVKVYTSANLWNKLSSNGLEVVREKFSIESVRGALHDVLQGLGLG